MTDKEIIKALECCVKAPYCSKKTDCPYKGIDDCVKKHTLDALDLINRQQAEIERLEKLSKDRADVNFEKMVGVIDRASADIEAKAIKGFAERLKEKLDCDVHTSEGFYFMVSDTIDNLVKEMVGEG